MKRTKRGRPLGSPNKPKDLGPTPETAAKLIPDAIKSLPSELQQAAVAIDRAYWAICGKLMCRASNLAPASPGKAAEFSGPVLILILRYQAWMGEAHRHGFHTEALIDMIVEGQRPEWCDHRYRWPAGESLWDLTEALKLYAKTKVRNLDTRLSETGDQYVLTGTAA
jgi:hypothetical protein